jgi:hypothetical protein
MVVWDSKIAIWKGDFDAFKEAKFDSILFNIFKAGRSYVVSYTVPTRM